MFNLFETPWLLLIISIIVLAVVTIIRQSRPDKSRWWQLLMPVILAGLAFGVDFFVKTDYEKIESVIDLASKAAAGRDIDQVDVIISPDYHDLIHDSKDELMAFCRAIFSTPLIEKTKTRYTIIKVSAPKATCELEVVVHLEPESIYAAAGRIIFIKAKLYFTKTPKRNWLISGSQILAVNNQPSNWKNIR